MRDPGMGATSSLMEGTDKQMVLVSGRFSIALLLSNPSLCANAQRGQTDRNMHWAHALGFDNSELSCVKHWGKRDRVVCV